MIGGQNHERVARANSPVDRIEELAQQPVSADRDIAHGWIVWPHRVPYIVVRGKADRQHIGGRVMAEILSLQRTLGKFLDHLVAPRRGFDRSTEADAGVLGHAAERLRRIAFGIKWQPLRAGIARGGLLLIQFLSPVRQFAAIVGAGDPCVGMVVVPVSAIRHVAGG